MTQADDAEFVDLLLRQAGLGLAAVLRKHETRGAICAHLDALRALLGCYWSEVAGDGRDFAAYMADRWGVMVHRRSTWRRAGQRRVEVPPPERAPWRAELRWHGTVVDAGPRRATPEAAMRALLKRRMTQGVLWGLGCLRKRDLDGRAKP